MRFVNNFNELLGVSFNHGFSVWNASPALVREFENALSDYVNIYEYPDAPDDLWESINRILADYGIDAVNLYGAFSQNGILYEDIPDEALQECIDLLNDCREDELARWADQDAEMAGVF